MAAIRLLIADDETLMRRLLVQMLSLEPDFEVVGEAEDGRQAVDCALKQRPDVVVMDLNMPRLNGAQATERIVARHPHIKVIILTALEELATVAKSSGAFECLDKGCTPEQLVDAIRRAHASKRAALPEQAAARDHRDAIERLATRGGLTHREKAVLEKIVSTELTTQEIAAALSVELAEEVTESSVKHTLERVMTKLRIEPRTRTALLKRVLEFGSMSPDEGAAE